MKKIAVFGKPGGGKSTLAESIAKALELPLHPLDLIEYHKNGEKVEALTFEAMHEELINTDSWVIDGFGGGKTFWSRLDKADVLVWVDLPYRVHYWRVVKRFLLSPFEHPKGWPAGSSVLKGTIAGIKFLRLSPTFWNEGLSTKLRQRFPNKKIYWLKSKREVTQLLQEISGRHT
ncbi:MAG: adenylate kinase [Thiotrichales bacterium SG8_50]|nr:MAG: adenylate kinase [Thiotrichales bacterium SG8_50]